jgi:hypothetical protein
VKLRGENPIPIEARSQELKLSNGWEVPFDTCVLFKRIQIGGSEELLAAGSEYLLNRGCVSMRFNFASGLFQGWVM